MLRKIAVYAAIILVTLVVAEVFRPLAALQSWAQSGCRTFPETGKTVCGKFLTYWDTHGGLAQQGFPISNPFQEKNDLDGKTYTVQYFERAVFEEHPENQPPYDVLLSQLGTFQFQRKYPSGDPSPPITTTPTPPTRSGDFEIFEPAVRIKGANVIVSGAIRYTGTATLINPEITVALLDKDGKEINSLPCCALVTLVRPGMYLPYRHEISDPDALMADVKVTAKASPATQADIDFYASDWASANVELVLPTDDRDFPKLKGIIKHNGSKPSEAVNVAAVIWDKDDNVLDVANVVLTISPANRVQGATLPFELTFELAAPASIGAVARHYDIIVQNDISPGN